MINFTLRLLYTVAAVLVLASGGWRCASETAPDQAQVEQRQAGTLTERVPGTLPDEEQQVHPDEPARGGRSLPEDSGTDLDEEIHVLQLAPLAEPGEEESEGVIVTRDVPDALLSEDEDDLQNEEIFVVVEQMPELIGGLGEIQKKIKYPEIARKAGVEGRVIIQFIVNESGNVSEPAVVRGIGAGCDEEALRVVRQAKFKPGKQRGKAVKVKMSLPITFALH